MVDNLLDTCLGISGSFEGRPGGPNWGLVSGNFDGMGISVGALQWNPGTGSIMKLLTKTFSAMGAMPPEFEEIHEMSLMKPRAAKDFAIQSWTLPGDPKGTLTDQGKALWESFLTTPECIQSQQELANVILQAAIEDAEHYLPWGDVSHRTAAFFFDLHVQQGGMSKRMDDGTYQTVPILGSTDEAQPQLAIDFANQQGKTKTATSWASVISNGDTLAAVLLHYAFARASMSRPQYVWDTLSRRGTIACRVGSVHGTWTELTSVLP